MVCGPGSLATRSRGVVLAHPGPTAPRPSPCLQLTPVLGQAVQGPHPLLSARVPRSLQARRLSSVPPTTQSPLKPLGLLPRGQTTPLCLPGVHPDLAGRTVAHRHGHPLTWLVHLLSRAPRPPRWAHRSVSCLYQSHGTARAPLPGDRNCLCCFPVLGPELIRTRDPTGRVSTSPRMTPQGPGCRA